MTTMNTPGQCLGTSNLFSSSRCHTKLVPESSYYGVEMTCNGNVYQLFSNYNISTNHRQSLVGRQVYLCHEPLKVFFQEFYKYVLGPRLGRSVSNKHARLLGFEGLDDPLVSEVEDQNDDYTLWEFVEEAMEPTLRFQMHTYVSRELGADGDNLEETNFCSLMSSSPSPKSSPLPSPLTLSPPSLT